MDEQPEIKVNTPPALAYIALIIGIINLLTVFFIVMLATINEAMSLSGMLTGLLIFCLVSISISTVAKNKVQEEELRGFWLAKSGSILSLIALFLTIILRFGVLVVFLPWLPEV